MLFLGVFHNPNLNTIFIRVDFLDIYKLRIDETRRDETRRDETRRDETSFSTRYHVVGQKKLYFFVRNTGRADKDIGGGL